MKFSPPAAPSAPSSELVLSDFLARFSHVEDETDGWVVPCPAHADGHPSLRVAVNESGSLLLHCRAGCSKDAVLGALGLSKADLFNVKVGAVAPRHTAPQVPLSRAHVAPLAAYLDQAALALQERGDAALRYASSRFGIGPETAAALGLGYDDGAVPHPGLGLSATAYQADARLVVPFLGFDGTPQGLQARALSNTARTRWSGPVNPKDGATWAKFGVFRSDSGLPDVEIIVTEGPGDALTATAVGYDTVCVRGAALGSNTALADELAEGLRGRRVVVAGDSDAAGAKFVAAVCEALSQRGVDTHRLPIPVGLSDVTEWREGDPASFAKRFADAVRSAERYGEDEVLADRLETEASHLMTDVYNARALRDYMMSRGRDVRYTEAAGFMVYQGDESGVWARDPKAVAVRTFAQEATGFIQRRVFENIYSVERRALSIADPDTRKRVSDVIVKLRWRAGNGGLVTWAMGTAGINAMLKELQSLSGVLMDYTDFDKDPDVLAVANGVVHLDTGALVPYSEDTRYMYLTRKVHAPYIEGASNPRWERFVHEILGGHDGLPEYVQRLMGYGITGRTSEQIIAVFLGVGDNGKGILTETLQTLFAEHTVVTPFSTFERREGNYGSGPSPEIARMAGARLVSASEGDAGRPMAEAMLKRISGADAVSARFLHQDDFTFEPTCLIILTSNHPPEIRGQDDGIWRRLKRVPFTRSFKDDPSKDKFLKDKLLGRRVPASAWRQADDMGDGLPGILAWVVRGAMLWYQEGLNEPDVVSRESRAYREGSDQLGDFILEKLVREGTATIKGSDMFKLYLEWAEEEGLAAKDKWTRRTFYRAMEERGAEPYLRGGAKAYRGFREYTPQERHRQAAHH